MNPYLNLFLSSVAAGMVQFGILVGAGVSAPLALIAGVIGTMGTAAIQQMRQFPREPWPEEKRAQQGEVK